MSSMKLWIKLNFLIFFWLSSAAVGQLALVPIDDPLVPSRYLTINGLRIAAYESKGQSQTTVFLIHGNTSSANSFARLMRSNFAKVYRVVAIDMPGYGRSDNSPSYNVALFNSVISQAAAALQADHGIIVGWSLGGDFALQVSSLLPNIKGYFLFGTAPVGGGPTVPTSFLTPVESYAGPATLYGFIPELLPFQIDQYVTAFFRPGYTNIASFFYQDGYRTDGGTRQAVVLAAAGADPDFKQEVPVAQNLQVPIALIHAEHDAFVRLNYLETIAPTIPKLWRGNIHVVSGVGHAIQWEQTETLTSLIRDFINELP